MGEGQVFKPEHGNGLIVRSQKKEEEEKKKKMMINITIEVYLDPALHLSKPFKTKMTTKFNVGLPFKVWMKFVLSWELGGQMTLWILWVDFRILNGRSLKKVKKGEEVIWLYVELVW